MDYRAYFFGNMYLSSIQQGIQAAHVVADMFIKYDDSQETNFHTLREWADEHKTVVLLNAGFSTEIRDLIAMFESSQNPFPWDYVCEAEEALDGAYTSIGIILPQSIYDSAKLMRNDPDAMRSIRETGSAIIMEPGKPVVQYELSKWEFELACRLNNYGLAR